MSALAHLSPNSCFEKSGGIRYASCGAGMSREAKGGGKGMKREREGLNESTLRLKLYVEDCKTLLY